MKPVFLKLVFLASNTNQTCEIGGNNDSGLSERRYHEDDSGTEYDKVVVLGSQIAWNRKKKKEDFQKERKSNRHKNKSKS